ncbi:MAG: MFS transporter [Candidatus Nanopelagicales bacterium]|nr:MFS transporter [Candidatus Nanopelagicales bacterium]
MSAPVLRPARTQATWVAYAQMGAYGAFVYSLGASTALLRDEQFTSRAVAGLHASAWALGLVVMSAANRRVTRRFGRGAAMRLGSVLMIVGILGYTSTGPTMVTLTAVFIAGLGGALMVAGLSAFLAVQQGPAAPAAVSEANAMGAMAGLLGAGGVGVGMVLALGWRPALWLLAGTLVALEVWRGNRLAAFNIAAPARLVESAGVRQPLPRLFWWSLLVMLPAAGVEYCVALWSADLLREFGGFEDAAAAVSLTVVVTGLIVGRIVGSRLVERYSPETLLISAFALSTTAFLVVWAINIAWVMLIFLFVSGCGIALHWPLAIARTIRVVPEQADRASGIGLLVAGVAIMIAPFALGALADVVGLRTAFLIVPLLSVFGAIMVWVRPVRLMR